MTDNARTTLRLPIRLVCTDFDGTLFDGTPNADDLLALKRALAALGNLHGTRWAIVTGRPLPDLLPVLGMFMSYGLFPDFGVVADALIYRRNALGGMSPFRWWNAKVAFRRHTLFRRHSYRVGQWRDEMMALFPGAADRSRQPVDLWLQFPDEDSAAEAETELHRKTDSLHGRFLVFRWGCEVFLAPAAGTKGEAVRRLGRHLRIPHQDIFAVGDGPNDLPMLRGGVVGMPACVGNAASKVREVVGQGGGYVAKGECLAGVLEALYFYGGV